MDYSNNDIRRKIIMEHYSNPVLMKSPLNRVDFSHYSNHCVDELHIEWQWKDSILVDVKWDGKGCAVFKSSTDIFLILSKNKSKEYIMNLAKNYENMINQDGKKYDKEILGDLNVFKNVKNQLNRLNCANMISQALIKKIG